MEIVLHHAGGAKPIPATWADQRKAGPLIVSMEKRRIVDGKPLHLFFTDVAVKQVGSDDWLNAE